MLLAKKIRLKPTPEQEILFRKSAGVARWAYNYFLSENNRVWQNVRSMELCSWKFRPSIRVQKRVLVVEVSRKI